MRLNTNIIVQMIFLHIGLEGIAMKIIFWNVNAPEKVTEKAEKITDCIWELIIENDIDLLILAEYGEDIEDFCNLTNKKSETQYAAISDYSCKKITGLVNSKYSLDILQGESRYMIIKISYANYKFLVGMIHNVARPRSSDSLREEMLYRFRRDIEKQEELHRCKNTIVIGDYNANPFEKACVSASSMHGIPFREEVERLPNRVIQGEVYEKFYNPTWKFFGNREIPYTTYHYNNSDMENYYWNAFDQVMIRPDLIKFFNEDEYKIITKTKSHNLMKNGKPNKVNYSDHLPLFCILKEDLI
jgi:exonuclease III